MKFTVLFFLYCNNNPAHALHVYPLTTVCNLFDKSKSIILTMKKSLINFSGLQIGWFGRLLQINYLGFFRFCSSSLYTCSQFYCLSASYPTLNHSNNMCPIVITQCHCLNWMPPPIIWHKVKSITWKPHGGTPLQAYDKSTNQDMHDILAEHLGKGVSMYWTPDTWGSKVSYPDPHKLVPLREKWCRSDVIHLQLWVWVWVRDLGQPIIGCSSTIMFWWKVKPIPGFVSTW